MTVQPIERRREGPGEVGEPGHGELGVSGLQRDVGQIEVAPQLRQELADGGSNDGALGRWERFLEAGEVGDGRG